MSEATIKRVLKIAGIALGAVALANRVPSVRKVVYGQTN